MLMRPLAVSTGAPQSFHGNVALDPHESFVGEGSERRGDRDLSSTMPSACPRRRRSVSSASSSSTFCYGRAWRCRPHPYPPSVAFSTQGRFHVIIGRRWCLELHVKLNAVAAESVVRPVGLPRAVAASSGGGRGGGERRR